MKRWGLTAASVAVLAVGGYLGADQLGDGVADAAEQQFYQFIEANRNRFLVYQKLPGSSPVSQVAVAVTDVADTTDSHVKVIHSQLHLGLANATEALVIPLNTRVFREKTRYNGVDYGFGKLVTTPDLSAITGLSASDDVLTSMHYIGLTGEVAEVDTVTPFRYRAKSGENVVDFSGLSSVMTTSAVRFPAMQLDIDFNGLQWTNNGEHLSLSPLKLHVTVEKDGAYTATSTATSSAFTWRQSGSLGDDSSDDDGRRQLPQRQLVLTLGEGAYQGVCYPVPTLRRLGGRIEASFAATTVRFDALSIPLTGLRLSAALARQTDALGGGAASGGDAVDTANGVTREATSKGGRGVAQAMNLSGAFSVHVDSNALAQMSQASTDSEALSGQLTHRQLALAIPVVPQQLAIDFQLRGLRFATDTLGHLANTTLTAKLVGETVAGNLHGALTMGFSEKGQQLSDADLQYAVNHLAFPEMMAFFRTNLRGQLHLHIDEKLANAERIALFLQLFLGVAPEKGQYDMVLQWSDGQLLINGRIVHLP